MTCEEQKRAEIVASKSRSAMSKLAWLLGTILLSACESNSPAVTTRVTPDASDASYDDGGTAVDAGPQEDAATMSDGIAGGDAGGSLFDGAIIACPATSDEIPGDVQSCELSVYCMEFRKHWTRSGDCFNCQNINDNGRRGVYHLGGCWRTDIVGGCTDQTSGGPTVTFYFPESQCGDASPCTSEWVQAHCRSPRIYVPPGM